MARTALGILGLLSANLLASTLGAQEILHRAHPGNFSLRASPSEASLRKQYRSHLASLLATRNRPRLYQYGEETIVMPCDFPDGEIEDAEQYDCDLFADHPPVRPSEEGNSIARLFAGPPLIDFGTLEALKGLVAPPPAQREENNEAESDPAERVNMMRGVASYVRMSVDVTRRTRMVPWWASPDTLSIRENAARLADTGVLFACSSWENLVVEEDVADAKPRDDDDENTEDVESCYFFSRVGRKDRSISLCEVVGNVEEDAPLRCQPFLVETRSGLWIAIVEFIEVMAKGSGEGLGPPTPDAALTLLLSEGWQSEGPAPRVLEIFTAALAASPLDLEVEAARSGYALRAWSPQRPSKLIPGYNEWIALWVDAQTCPADDAFGTRYASYAAVCISYRGSLFVNRQRDTDVAHWRAPASAMIHALQRNIRESFRRELSRSCKSVQDAGAKIVCAR